LCLAVTNSSGCSKVCTQSFSVNDTVAPTFTCPNDFYCVVGGGNDCSSSQWGAPSNISDDCGGTPIVAHKDVTNGTCPQVITRTWYVSDSCGNTNKCTQTITLVCQPSLVTDTVRCTLTNLCGTTGDSFRLIFTQDPQMYPCFRVTASNPGQFYYNVFYSAPSGFTPGTLIPVTVVLPYPFVTQGANPVEVYDSVKSTTTGGVTCLVPGNKTYAGTNKVTLTSYSSPPTVGVTTYTLNLSIPLPSTGFIFLAIHLDYGLKQTSGYGADGALDATLCGTQPQPLVVPNGQSYKFSVSGPVSDSHSVSSCNDFKKTPGTAGITTKNVTFNPVPNCNAVLKDSKGTVLGTSVTDTDGWYAINYKWTGKAATFYVTLTPPGGTAQTQTITLKANGFIEADFTAP